MTPAQIISRVAALMNDAAQTDYTDTAVLPYLNMAMTDLQEIFEQNNVPVTNETPATIEVPAGTTEIPIRFSPDPKLPADLVEIQQVWESPSGENNWTPVQRVEFLPLYWENTQISQFLIFAFNDQKIKLIPAIADNDLKLNYIKSLFIPIEESQLQIPLGIINADAYLYFRTAALCAMYIAENPTRAEALAMDAQMALDRSVGISAKGRQSIVTRRRPFRASWKLSGTW